jgi:hypothetical protein
MLSGAVEVIDDSIFGSWGDNSGVFKIPGSSMEIYL